MSCLFGPYKVIVYTGGCKPYTDLQWWFGVTDCENILLFTAVCETAVVFPPETADRSKFIVTGKDKLDTVYTLPKCLWF